MQHTIRTQYAHNNMQHIHLSTEQDTEDTHIERTQNAHTQDNNKDICSTQKITENKTTQHRTTHRTQRTTSTQVHYR